MKKYNITYTRNGKEIKTSRKANSPAEAVEKLCEQYGYECKVNQFDADTYGKKWAEVEVRKPEYGYHSWIFTALAELAED